MRQVLHWFLRYGRAITLLVLAGYSSWSPSLLLRVVGLGSPLVDWLPLLPSPLNPTSSGHSSSRSFFSPGLLVLTTVFAAS